MYLNPPPEVAALKTMLEASSTWSAMSGGIHYPSTSDGASASPDAIPNIVIEPARNSPKVIAPGVVVPGGTIQAILTMKDSSGSAIEKSARSIADEVSVMTAGLPILSAEVGMCSMPDPGDRAAQSFDDQQSNSQTASIRRIQIIFTYGLT